MFFPDLLRNDQDRAEHEKVCTNFSAFLKECLAFLVEAYQISGQAAGKTGEVYHGSIVALTYHVIEYIDGVALLISQGGSQPCLPLLRSALEATLGVMYIFKDDTKRRALAYQVAYTHRLIKHHEQIDPTTKEGRFIREYLGDEADAVFGWVSVESHIKNMNAVEKLKAMLAKPDYLPIEQEWQRQKKKEPNWYSLFSGPNDARALAKAVGWEVMYDFNYHHWSTEIHAGLALKAAGLMDGERVMRPIRHPEVLQTSVLHASNFTLELAYDLIKHYAPEKLPELKKRYLGQIQKRTAELVEKKIITAPWKDSDF